MESSVAALWPWYGLLTTSQAVTLSLDHNGRYLSSGIDLTAKKSASKSSAVSAQELGILYWPAWWVAYKRKSGRTSHQSAASDRHRHNLRGHNLNYTIWKLYAESVS
jgi:hypothetical protein